MSTAAVEVTPEDKSVDAESLERWCIDYIARTLNIPASEIHPDGEFHSFGLDSAVATAMILDLEEWLGIEVPPSAIFEQVTISNLVTDLMAKLAAAKR
ncbi:acyl carrier protein [Aquabacterium sp. A7-Y]|uniref:acyl carrier protein n=1 Tax=Aquabacterium sp. A7-Y TaxID=1349605 RepID=UPI00223DD281|nr:acyl carrier protein [Aquabacterium sp. A7-Y]MCW7541680.1 acyl carrier protein [Aquabacterium sp. A7-Y]